MRPKKPKKMGRPRLPASMKKSVVLSLKVTRDEHRRLRIEARRTGLSIPALLMRPWREEG